jgi:hypothetical protein
MTELVVRRIEVDLKYVPKGWASQVMFDELERGVAHAIADGGAEVKVQDFASSVTHWFVLKDVPLEEKAEGHKALLSVDIYEQMTMVHHLVSLEQVGV